MSFKLLSKELQNILRELGFDEETEPQRKAIPIILQKKNVLLISPTGTGKTEAALLPVLDMIKEDKSKGIKVLYITPLKSLNRNLMDRITLWCSKLDLKVAVRHGDTPPSERRKQMLQPPDLLITTPETLQILLVSKNMRENMKTIKHVIIDEIHELAESKRGSQLALGIERLRLISGDFQIIGLSATVGEPEKLAKFLVGNERVCEIILAYEERKMRFKICYPRPSKEDFLLSEKILTYPEAASRVRKITEAMRGKKSTLIFTNTRSESEILASRMRMLGVDIFVHHSSLSKEARISAESSLKLGEIKGIVCTSSLELGIDIGNIDYVIQYNSPRQATRLVQRIGRSSHYLGGVAEGLIVATTLDTFLESYVIAEKALRGEYERIVIPEKPLDVLAHQLVGYLLEYGETSIQDFLKLAQRAYPYRDLRLDELDKVVELLQNLKPKGLIRKGELILKSLGSYYYYFENLSMIPDQVQYAVIDFDTKNFIGVLDEDFIAEFGEEGTRFILKGEAWEILFIEEDNKRVICKKVETGLGVVPTWVGEEIPVERDIAKKTAEIRKELYDGIVNLNLELLDIEDFEIVNSILKAEKKKDIEIPDPHELLIEEDENVIVINSSNGTKMNRTLSKVLSYVINERLRKNFRVHSDAYRIYIISKEIEPIEVLEILKKLQFYDLDDLISRIFNETDPLFRYRFTHVAKRFGIIKKEATIDKKIIIELARQYKDSPIYEETLKELFSKDLEIDTLKELIKKISKNEIKIRISATISELTKEALKYVLIEAGIPSNKDPSKFVLEAYKVRLYSRILTVFCMDCKEYVEAKSFASISTLVCPFCGSNKLAVSRMEPSSVIKYLNNIIKNSKDVKVRRLYKKWEKIGELIAKKGKIAFIAAASNISYKSIQELTTKFDTDNDDFYLSLIKEETNRLNQILKRTSKAKH
ncbi:MAG TPA: DEAD/DEAH box helicase [Geobacterales bacterium]|nr:DEAD/DEAH box helicase [Geobacterales bacterium]